MSFVAALALAIGVLVAAPYFAHRLRRKRADERPFAATRLVAPTPPKARRRSQLEDRGLFAVRAACVVALALLGASPLIRCSRLALSRGGASVAVAIVLDDSMSMRASNAGKTRFARAKRGAADVLASLHDGDAAAIVLAGAPAHVGLAATTDIGAAKAALDRLVEGDRATDVDGAVAIARTLIADLPQLDRRIILLSDLADGHPEKPPIGEGTSPPLWLAMPDLAGPASDCAILAADRATGRVRVRFACSGPEAARGREARVRDGEQILAHAQLPETALGEVSIPLTGDDTKEVTADLDGRDAIAEDDRAPVVAVAGASAVAVVGDRADEALATGGAPILEQALAALHVDMAVRPIPITPDRREDLAGFAAMILDDPPGFTPEQRHALDGFVEQGGVVLVALGPRSAAAPLGANFEPFLGRAVAWGTSPVPGADGPLLGEAAASFADLSPKGRARLADEDVSAFESLVTWSDGKPLVARRARGRGDVWVSTLPLSVDTSDVALRPGFFAILDGFLAAARTRSSPRRGDVGMPWLFPGARSVQVGEESATRENGVLRFVPERVGAYRIDVDGTKELRVAAPIAREVDFRPRAVAPSATAAALGGGVAVVDVSWIIALCLLGLVAIELGLRAIAPRRPAEGSA